MTSVSGNSLGSVSVALVGPYIPTVKVFDVSVGDVGVTAVLSRSLLPPFSTYRYRLSLSPLSACCGARHVGGVCVECDSRSSLSDVHVSFEGAAVEPFSPVGSHLGSFDECVERFLGAYFPRGSLFRGVGCADAEVESLVRDSLKEICEKFSELLLSAEFLAPWRSVPLSGSEALFSSSSARTLL